MTVFGEFACSSRSTKRDPMKATIAETPAPTRAERAGSCQAREIAR